jgi:hypothetical protein
MGRVLLLVDGPLVVLRRSRSIPTDSASISVWVAFLVLSGARCMIGQVLGRDSNNVEARDDLIHASKILLELKRREDDLERQLQVKDPDRRATKGLSCNLTFMIQALGGPEAPPSGRRSRSEANIEELLLLLCRPAAG